LVIGAAVGVEDGVLEGSGHGVLSVGGERVCDQSLLRLRACKDNCVSPPVSHSKRECCASIGVARIHSTEDE
jgi:hypothetical protein